MRKKEIIVSAIIILFVVGLASSSFLIDLFKNDNQTIEKETKEERYITITFKGELVVDEISFKIVKGSTYGSVLPKLLKYTNDYSIIDYEKEFVFNSNKTIIIESTDVGEAPNIDVTGLININTASKELLMKIDGIKDKRSDRIIEYRKTKQIESFSELQALIGVSDAVIEGIKKQATL